MGKKMDGALRARLRALGAAIRLGDKASVRIHRRTIEQRIGRAAGERAPPPYGVKRRTNGGVCPFRFLRQECTHPCPPVTNPCRPQLFY